MLAGSASVATGAPVPTAMTARDQRPEVLQARAAHSQQRGEHLDRERPGQRADDVGTTRPGDRLYEPRGDRRRERFEARQVVP